MGSLKVWRKRRSRGLSLILYVSNLLVQLLPNLLITLRLRLQPLLVLRGLSLESRLVLREAGLPRCDVAFMRSAQRPALQDWRELCLRGPL